MSETDDHAARAPPPAEGGADASPDVAALQERWSRELMTMIPTLRKYAWSLSRNAADTDDLVQETLIKALSHRTGFQPGSNLRSWLFTILRNTHFTSYARRAREVGDKTDAASRLVTLPNQQWTLELQDVAKAFRHIPPNLALAVRLVDLEGLSYEEAANHVGCPLGTVKSRVNRGRARLQELMEAERPAP